MPSIAQFVALLKKSGIISSILLFLAAATFFLSCQPSAVQARQLETDDKAGFFADRTVPDMLVRFPGVYRNLDGSLNIRGTGGRFDLFLNGHPTAYSSLGGRSYFLDAFSADAVQSVAFGSATGQAAHSGRADVLNLAAHPAGRTSGQQISGVAGLGALPQYSRYGGPVGRVAVQHLQPLSDKADAGARLTWQTDHTGMEELSLDFDAAEFDGATRDVLRSVTPSYLNELSRRMSGSVWFVWTPADHTELTASLNHFQTDMRTDRHAQSHDTKGDWLRPDTTGLAGGQGAVRYEANTADRTLTQTDLQFSGISRFDNWDLRYRLNWSQADSRRDLLRIPFSREGTDFSIDMSDRLRPVMHITGVPVLDNSTIDYRTMRMGAMEQTLQEHKNGLVSAAIGVQYRPLGLSAGADIRSNHHDAWFEQSGYNFFQVLNLYRFFMIPQGSMEVFGKPGYLIPWMVDTGDARNFLEGNLPRFSRNEEDVVRNSATENFSVEEGRVGAYTTYSGGTGSVDLEAGLRVEYIRGRYEGTVLLTGGNGSPEPPERSRATTDRTDFLPFARIKWGVTPSASLALQYMSGVNNADFSQLVPFSLTDSQLLVRRKGNPDLNPEYINNVDLTWRYESEANTGLSITVFYRHLSNAILKTSRILSGGEQDGFLEFGYENSGNDAHTGGFELQMEHRLVSLPGPLSGFTILGNYTFTESRTEVDFRPEETFRLPGQSRHHLNAALRFEAGRLASQASYRYTSGALRTITTEAIPAPSASSGQLVYPDLVEPDTHLLTGSLRFRLSDNFTFWTDAAFDPVRTRSLYYHSPDIYPTLIQRRQGLAFRSGILFQF
ncbi:MAG: hypothetical protein EA363_04270 [Balneolaceae bacterium]|nr:MAG: hypothetical protein EA363_04270 [Balneolaceae bacterium]